MNDEAEKREKQNINRKLLIRSMLSMAVVLVILITATYAWFTDRANMATLVEIKSPTAIAILGPHGEAQASLDMSYTDDDVDENGKVTIKRVVSVSSDAAKHQLEIAHTTNLKGLTFAIYRASEATGVAEGTAGTLTEDNYTYTYDESSPLQGAYINLKTDNGNYKYADESMHSHNFESYDRVQSHAEPLYWMAADDQDAELRDESNTNVTTKYLTYYVVEISWTEDTKETDLFYLLAKNR